MVCLCIEQIIHVGHMCYMSLNLLLFLPFSLQIIVFYVSYLCFKMHLWNHLMFTLEVV